MSTNPDSYQRIDQRPEEPLSPEEREILRLQEHAELLTRGKLFKHLKKKHKIDELAMDRFGRIASEVSEFEVGMFEHGVLTEATWRHKRTKESGVRVLAGLVIGIFAALIPSGEDVLIEYTTRHRLSPETVRWYFWRRILLSGAYVLLIAVGMLSILWLIFGVALLLDQSATEQEQWWSAASLLVCPLVFLAAHKVKQSIVPPLLRIYGGKGFELVSLKVVEP